MKPSFPTFTTATAILAAIQLMVAVQANSAEEKEKSVAFRLTGEKHAGKYITTNTGNSLDLSGSKVGSKQTFALIDRNGGEVADGDEIRVRYVPNTEGKPDPSKASYWRELPEGVKRGKDSTDVFKLKLVETNHYVFVAPSGKFVGAPLEGGLLAVTDKQEDALCVELVDLKPAAAAKTSK